MKEFLITYFNGTETRVFANYYESSLLKKETVVCFMRDHGICVLEIFQKNVKNIEEIE